MSQPGAITTIQIADGNARLQSRAAHSDAPSDTIAARVNSPEQASELSTVHPVPLRGFLPHLAPASKRRRGLLGKPGTKRAKIIELSLRKMPVASIALIVGVKANFIRVEQARLRKKGINIPYTLPLRSSVLRAKPYWLDSQYARVA